ncbi:4Fe-4S ferredoxin N-terminal domain-containing protein [Halobacteriaceae archaeon GCM10025711]
MDVFPQVPLVEYHDYPPRFGRQSPGGGGRHEWNREEAVRRLDGSDYDTELGLRMARDAVRVANGDLDEDVFRERYHEAVVAEFGVDDRPVAREASADE